MENTTPILWDPSEAGAASQDDALLFEALAFIGDLEGDDDDAPGAAPIQSDVTPVETTGFFSTLLETPLTTEKTEDAAISDGTQLTQNSPPGKGTKAATLNRSRTRRREELLYLRDLMGNLEDRLTGLRRAADEQQLALTKESGVDDVGSSRDVLAAWELVAVRQYEQRHRSEMENIRLRRLLEDQIQVGKSLERLLLRKRPKVESLEGGRSEKRVRNGSLSDTWDTTQIFKELLASLERQYAETARTFSEVRHLFSSLSQRDVQLVHLPELGMVLRTIECQIYPFSYDDTCHVIWKSMPEVSNAHKTHAYHKMTSEENLMKVEFQVEVDMGRAMGVFKVCMACRRHVEADRTVIVSTAFFDPSHVSNTSMEGIYMRHRGWLVVEPFVSETTKNGGPAKVATKMTMYSIAVPETDDHVQDPAHKVGALTNFLLTAISLEMEARHQMLENKLFERSLAAAK